MGRTVKEGLDYFPLDTVMDTKIKLIKAEFGLVGFALVVMLYQKIYGEHGYYCEWTDEVALLFASETGVGGCVVSELIAACIRRGIFSEEMYTKYSILTSKGVQERYFEATSRRVRSKLKDEYLLVSIADFKINVAEMPISVAEKGIYVDINTTKESKVNKSKVNKNSVVQYDNADLYKKPSVCNGSITKGVIILSDEQMDELVELMPLNVLNHYLQKLADFIISKDAVVRNHFETIKRWYEKDYGGQL